MSRLVLLGPDEVSEALKRWPQIAGELQKGVERSGGVMTLESIGQDLRRDHLQLWLVLDEAAQELIGIVLTHLGSERSGLKTCTVYLAAGKGLRGEMGHMTTIEAWARDQCHCARMVIYARKGWAREMPDYDLSQYLLTKTLTGDDHGRRRQSAGIDNTHGAPGGVDASPDDNHGPEQSALRHGGAEPLHGPAGGGIYH